METRRVSREQDHIVSALVALCKEKAITCVVQVGAEDGYEADAIRNATGARAVCIEADPKCCRCSTGLEYHRVLIGAEDCIHNFFVHETMGLSSTLTRADGQEQHIAMEQYRLDTFCTLHGIEPDALIIDTEGTTLDVLEGAEGILGKMRLIYAECQDMVIRPGVRTVAEVETFLAARGFVEHNDLPSYSAGSQGNYTWVKP